MIAEVPKYQQSELLSERDKAAIRLADAMAGDHRSASEALFDELREHFEEPEILDLAWRISTFLGYGRLIHVLGLEIGKTCPLPR